MNSPLPLSPKREAIKLVQLWRAAHGSAFPINAESLAQEWSRQTVPEGPIGEVIPQELQGFEGGLFWLDQRKVWALLYHPHPQLPGRANFTVAHEFGHFVLHRKLQNIFECTQAATLGLNGVNIELEADQFASYLLMPIDDFRSQVNSQAMSMDLLTHCANRYGVSLTAAILKWLEFTDKAAVVVVGREGMLQWWRASDAGRPYAFEGLCRGMDLPPQAMVFSAGRGVSNAEARIGRDHPEGVWFSRLAVREMAVVSDLYDMSISLLLLDVPPLAHDEEPIEDMTNTPPRFRT